MFQPHKVDGDARFPGFLPRDELDGLDDSCEIIM